MHTAYRDPKRWLWLLSAVYPLTVVANLLRFERDQQPAWLFLSPLFIYVAIPLLDQLLRPDPRNPPDEAVAQLEADPWYRLLVLAFVPFYYAVLLLGCWLAVRHAGEPLVWLGLVLSVAGAYARYWGEHAKILEAVLAGDAAAAEEHARRHTAAAGEETALRLEAEYQAEASTRGERP